MKGYPKHLNTKQDYEYVRNHFPKRKWEKDFQALLKSEKAWQVTKTLAEGKKGVEDETHKVIESEEEIVQMELKRDENSKMKKIGYSPDEIHNILTEQIKNKEILKWQSMLSGVMALIGLVLSTSRPRAALFF